MAKGQVVPIGASPVAEELLDRFRANLSHVAKQEGASVVARYSDVSRESIYKIMRGERVPGLDTFVALSVYLDIESSMWFLPPDQFAASLRPAEERNRFFAPPRRRSDRDSSLGSEDSNQSAAGTRYRAKSPRRLGRTSQSGASNRCFMHTRNDQHVWIAAPREHARKRRGNAHSVRRARPLWVNVKHRVSA